MPGDRKGALAAATILLAAIPPLASAAVRPPPGVVAAPLHSSGSTAAYPRLIRFPDAKVMARVNAALAAQETSDRRAKKDCYAQIRDQKQEPDADSYDEEITVGYLSRHFLNVNVTTSYDCATPYPTNGAEFPMTFDLDTGAPVDWKTMFKPGFLPADNADENAPPSALTRLYRARYRPDSGKDDDCLAVVAGQDPFASAPSFWLDAKRGLVVEPDFPHVIAACADDMALSAADVAPYLRDPALADDLRRVVGR